MGWDSPQWSGSPVEIGDPGCEDSGHRLVRTAPGDGLLMIWTLRSQHAGEVPAVVAEPWKSPQAVPETAAKSNSSTPSCCANRFIDAVNPDRDQSAKRTSVIPAS